MDPDLLLRRKWTLRAHGRQVVFVKRPGEKTAHVIMKALLWALYLSEFPDLMVERDVSGRYRPDVISLAPDGRPRFWGEVGEVRLQKVRALARRYRSTHLAIGKWDTALRPFVELMGRAVRDLDRSAPFDLIRFPPDSSDRFIDPEGTVRLSRADLEWIRLW